MTASQTQEAPFKVISPMGTLGAFSVEDAESVKIWPDSIIVRTSDGEWMDRPLSVDTRERLAEIHGIDE